MCFTTFGAPFAHVLWLILLLTSLANNPAGPNLTPGKAPTDQLVRVDGGGITEARAAGSCHQAGLTPGGRDPIGMEFGNRGLQESNSESTAGSSSWAGLSRPRGKHEVGDKSSGTGTEAVVEDWALKSGRSPVIRTGSQDQSCVSLQIRAAQLQPHSPLA